MSREKKKFTEGCMWEDGWEVWFDQEIRYTEPCKHCHSDHIKTSTRHDGSTYETRVFICPRVIIAFNEGGHDSTGICLDCILEAVKTLESS